MHSVLDLATRDGQAWCVRTESGNDDAHGVENRPRLTVEFDQSPDHPFVVRRVGMVVHLAVTQLPRATQLLERIVQRKELHVVRFERTEIERPHIARQRLTMRLATLGRQLPERAGLTKHRPFRCGHRFEMRFDGGMIEFDHLGEGVDSGESLDAQRMVREETRIRRSRSVRRRHGFGL